MVHQILEDLKKSIEGQNAITQLNLNAIDYLIREFDNLKAELKEIKSNVVLTKDMINREGRPKALTEEEIQKAIELRNSNYSYQKIADKLNEDRKKPVSHETIRRAVNEQFKTSNRFSEEGLQLPSVKLSNFKDINHLLNRYYPKGCRAKWIVEGKTLEVTFINEQGQCKQQILIIDGDLVKFGIIE